MWHFGLSILILYSGSTFFAFVYAVLMLALSIAFLSCSVRRLHDIGLSGWWLWVSYAPFVIDRNDSASSKSTYLVLFGFMYSIKMLITKGEEVENKYGPDPYSEL